ncbi:WXG100 family type VII secretion target [Gordonia sp. TBRC 11910]|uniref:ESAT-6-like protein n=1 Tax=Gordonia asplenii TaxID=2725283 RepID=A0A848KWD3_9ACTN|nr:WXG100 family type VII secretion target [Gordonia asplenii]NMO00481.1 WXG100 family type VII secretion target [Gordonia asplenii]
MADYSYDHTAAQHAEQRVETAATNLQSAVDDLEAHVKKLAAAWSGDEHDAYSGVHSKVSRGFESITQVLTQIRQTLGDNSQQVLSMQKGINNTILHG